MLVQSRPFPFSDTFKRWHLKAQCKWLVLPLLWWHKHPHRNVEEGPGLVVLDPWAVAWGDLLEVRRFRCSPQRRANLILLFVPHVDARVFTYQYHRVQWIMAASERRWQSHCVPQQWVVEVASSCGAG